MSLTPTQSGPRPSLQPGRKAKISNLGPIERIIFLIKLKNTPVTRWECDQVVW